MLSCVLTATCKAILRHPNRRLRQLSITIQRYFFPRKTKYLVSVFLVLICDTLFFLPFLSFSFLHYTYYSSSSLATLLRLALSFTLCQCIEKKKRVQKSIRARSRVGSFFSVPLHFPSSLQHNAPISGRAGPGVETSINHFGLLILNSLNSTFQQEKKKKRRGREEKRKRKEEKEERGSNHPHPDLLCC